MDVSVLFEDVLREKIRESFGEAIEKSVDSAFNVLVDSGKLGRIIEDEVKDMVHSATRGHEMKFDEEIDRLIMEKIAGEVKSYFETKEGREEIQEKFRKYFADFYGEDYVSDALRDDARFYGVIDDYLISTLREALGQNEETEEED